MEGNSSGIGSNTTRMLPSAQFWKCANSWRRNWRNDTSSKADSPSDFKRLSNEAQSGHGSEAANVCYSSVKQTYRRYVRTDANDPQLRTQVAAGFSKLNQTSSRKSSMSARSSISPFSSIDQVSLPNLPRRVILEPVPSLGWRGDACGGHPCTNRAKTRTAAVTC